MDRPQRLQEIFAGDEALLELDTQLTTKEEPPDDPWDFPVQPAQETMEFIVAPEPQPAQQDRPDTTHLSPRKIPEWELRNAFCPAKALPKFPFKYIFPQEGELPKKVAKDYFDGGLVWRRGWDVYYLPIPTQISDQPLLLIPALQVKEFLDTINYQENYDLALTTRTKDGMVLFFDADDGTPKPVQLGHIDNRESLDLLETHLPLPKEGDDDWTKSCERGAFDIFHKKVHDGFMSFKRRKQKPKRPLTPMEKAIAGISKQHVNQRIPTRGLYQLKAYFGLRPPINERGYFAKDEEFAPVKVDAPVPWNTDGNPIFYSIDVEWNEWNAAQVTEIGISSLDTIDIHGIPPGPGGENWVKHIKSAHLRTTEYKNFCNKKFVAGCPDQFLFGKSELVPNARLGRRADCFFVAPYDGTARTTRPGLPQHKLGPRTIVLVGHNPDADVRVLSERCRIFESLKNQSDKVIREVMDTQILYGCLRKESLRSLENILLGLGVEFRCLHNAGNDARFTLEALIRIALEPARKKPEDPNVEVKTGQKVVVQEAEVAVSQE